MGETFHRYRYTVEELIDLVGDAFVSSGTGECPVPKVRCRMCPYYHIMNSTEGTSSCEDTLAKAIHRKKVIREVLGE
jgi:hypothetical protein